MHVSIDIRNLLLVLGTASALACTQSSPSPLSSTRPTELPGPSTRARLESLDIIQERASCQNPVDQSRPCDTVPPNPDGSVSVPPGTHRLRVVWVNPHVVGRIVVLTVSVDWSGSLLNTAAVGTPQENTIVETSPEDGFSVIPGVPGRSALTFRWPAGVPLGRITATIVETGRDLPTETRDQRELVIQAR